MREQPILFRPNLVRAILEDRKTQTRRTGTRAPLLYRLAPGDRLWVREAYKEGRRHDGATARLYRADGDPPHPDWSWPDRWTPGIHMPRAASRLTLEVTEIPRIEPLQAITDNDALAEGVVMPPRPSILGPRDRFSVLWDEVNAARGLGWSTNPKVVVVTFRRLPPLPTS